MLKLKIANAKCQNMAVAAGSYWSTLLMWIELPENNFDVRMCALELYSRNIIIINHNVCTYSTYFASNSSQHKHCDRNTNNSKTHGKDASSKGFWGLSIT